MTPSFFVVIIMCFVLVLVSKTMFTQVHWAITQMAADVVT